MNRYGSTIWGGGIAITTSIVRCWSRDGSLCLAILGMASYCPFGDINSQTLCSRKFSLLARPTERPLLFLPQHSILRHGTAMDSFLDFIPLLPEAGGPKVYFSVLSSRSPDVPVDAERSESASRVLSSRVFSVPLCTSLCRLCCSMGSSARVSYTGIVALLYRCVTSRSLALDHVAHSLRHSVARISSRSDFISHY